MSESPTFAWRTASAPQRYGVAVASVTAAVLAAAAVERLLAAGPAGRFVDAIMLIDAAVVISAWVGGIGPGLLAVGLATLAVDYFFAPPLSSSGFGAAYLSRHIVFVLSVLVIGWLGVTRQRAEDALRRARDELEVKVRERTADLTRSNEQLQTEVAERKRVEAVLREQASLLDLTHDTIFVRDANDVIIYWNRGAEELYGWTKEEAVGKVSHQLTRTIFPVPLEEITAELLRTGRWEGELVHTKRDGTQVVVASRWSLQRNLWRPVAILETNNDITERKRGEAALLASERRYRHIFQTMGVSIWEEDFSEVKAAIDALKAMGVGDFRQYLAKHPEFIGRAISMVKIVDVNDATVRMFEARSKDDLLVSLHEIFLPETQEVFAEELIAIAEGRTSFESEAPLQTLKGDRRTVLFSMTFPLSPANLDSVLVNVVDITERRQVEEALREAQAELAHISRVLTTAELTASIAHEINQPLAAVVTNGAACLRWLGGDPPNLDEARAAVARIIRDGNRASEVIARVRALLRKSVPQKTRLDVNDVVREVIALAHREVRRQGVSLRTSLADDLLPVLGDRVQLQQVLLNLIMNGVEAMKPVTDRPRVLAISTERHEAGGVLVAVEDTGIGLSPQTRDRLFDPFFTTKPAGMGMGLSISRSIVEAHGGRLWASPGAGPGATFRFTLPMIAESEA